MSSAVLGARSPPSPSAAAPVVVARGLDAGYPPENVVWRDAEFTIERGEFVAVIGPNGAGKTTAFRLLLGLLPPLRGSLRVFDAPPERGSPKIGYVPQRHAIDFETHVRCFELVRLGHSGHRWGFPRSGRVEREAAWSALDAVGARSLADRPLSALSGGELQRIFLAEALVGTPELLLLDEPLSNLDLRRSRELVGVIHGVVRSHRITALLVAHDINPLIPYLDKVIYVANGKVASGAPGEVLTSERLSRLYGLPVEVLRDSRGHLVIVGGEEHTEGELGGGEDHHEGEASGGYGHSAGVP
ncbi:MAG: ATP-binding cassette domain-containing protein [Thermoplasmata archaeon]|nr:ATP-binding cassette domain-containing protein [Thermoplasmata archaeon]